MWNPRHAASLYPVDDCDGSVAMRQRVRVNRHLKPNVLLNAYYQVPWLSGSALTPPPRPPICFDKPARS
eukprot:4416312-Amphidinium_carterae.2